ncbi:hypothetical protein CHISP_0578 [Chitinispirillum alkaliphilum]|nr:hypothetical protein CHISP_0578 [Chitinispirillum alkaliphilum]
MSVSLARNIPDRTAEEINAWISREKRNPITASVCRFWTEINNQTPIQTYIISS